MQAGAVAVQSRKSRFKPILNGSQIEKLKFTTSTPQRCGRFKLPKGSFLTASAIFVNETQPQLTIIRLPDSISNPNRCAGCNTEHRNNCRQYHWQSPCAAFISSHRYSYGSTDYPQYYQADSVVNRRHAAGQRRGFNRICRL